MSEEENKDEGAKIEDLEKSFEIAPKSSGFVGHPVCRLSNFIRIRKEKPGLSIEEATQEAEKRCVEANKLHGVIRLSKEAQELGYKLVRPKK